MNGDSPLLPQYDSYSTQEIPRPSNVSSELRPVIVSLFQWPYQVFEACHHFNCLFPLFPCQNELHINSLTCDLHIPPSYPHLRVLEAMRHSPVLEPPPLRHMHSVHVAAGQRLPPLLQHRNLGNINMYMKCSLIRPAMWAISGHPYNGHSTNFRILGKETTCVVGPPLPTSTPCVCFKIAPCDRSM